MCLVGFETRVVSVDVHGVESTGGDDGSFDVKGQVGGLRRRCMVDDVFSWCKPK